MDTFKRALQTFYESFQRNFRASVSILLRDLGQVYKTWLKETYSIFTFLIFGDTWTPAPHAIVNAVDGIANAFNNFRQNAFLVPVRDAVLGELVEAFPVPKKAGQRVVKLDDAYRMAAGAIANGFFEVFIGLPQLPPASVSFAQGLTAKWTVAQEVAAIRPNGIAKAFRNLGKVGVGAIIKAIAYPILIVSGMVLMIAMLTKYAEAVNDDSPITAPAKVLTNQNPFVVRKQRHRVRDNPKLTTR